MKTRAFFVVVILLFGWFFIVEKGERRSDVLIASKSVEEGKKGADSTVANPGANWTKEGKGEQNLRKGRLEAKQRDQSHNPGWAVPFGAEFWRKRDFGAGGMKGVWLTKAPPLRGDSAAVQEAIERVTHAFQRDAKGTEVETTRYKTVLQPDGLLFVAKRYGDDSGGLRIQTSVADGNGGNDGWSVVGNTAQRRLREADEVVEHVETRETGTFLTWIIAKPRRGMPEEEFRVRVSGMSYVGQSAKGHHFADKSGVARVRFGNAVAVDSAGSSWPVRVESASEGLKIHVPSDVLAQAVYPLAIDPEITAERGIDVREPLATGTGVYDPSLAANGDLYLAVWSQYAVVRGARISADGRILDPGGFVISMGDPSRLNYFSAVASDGDGFLVVWREMNSSSIWGASVTADGQVRARASLIGVRNEYNPPAVAFGGGNYLVTWTDGAVYGQIVSSSALTNNATRIAISGDVAANGPAIVWTGTNFMVGWQSYTSTQTPTAGAYVRRVTATGEMIDQGTIYVGPHPDASRPMKLVAAPGRVLASWGAPVSNGAITLLTTDGQVLWTKSPMMDAAVTWKDDAFWFAWATEDHINVNRLSLDGEWLEGSGKKVFQHNTQQVSGLRIANLEGTNVLITYLGNDGLYSHTVSEPVTEAGPGFSAGAMVSARALDNGPAVAPLGEGHLVVWSGNTIFNGDLYGARLDANGNLLEPNGFLISNAAGEQNAPQVASKGDEALVVWQDLRYPEVFGARIASNGSVLDTNGFLISTDAPPATSPAVTASKDQYFVVWDAHSGGWQVRGALVGFDGKLKSTPIAITPFEPRPAGFLPKVSSDGSDFLVVWHTPFAGIGSSWQSEPTGYTRAKAARITAAGSVLNYGGFILAFNAADQLYPVAAFAGGNYLVAWLEMRDPATRAVSLWVAPVFSDGTTAPAKMVLPEDPNRSQIALAGNANQFFVSWRKVRQSSPTSSDILGAYLRPDGSISDEGIFDINGGSTTWAPSISISPSAGIIIAAKGTRPNTYKVVWNGTQSFEPPMTGVDDFTGGSWKSRYGGKGEIIASDATVIPAFAQVSFEGELSWTWAWNAAGETALERASSNGRVAACWYSPDSFNVRMTFTDGQEHAVAFYFLDWDSEDREQLVEVLDTASGRVLQSHYLRDFHDGRYLIYSLSGDVQVRFTREAGYNAVLSGIFFPEKVGPIEKAAMPMIDPNGGTFAGPTSVSLSTATTGATIYYTLDGSEPSAEATLYGGPISVESTSMLKAIAVKEGFADSAVASATFIIQSGSGNEVRFVGEDRITQGNWVGKYGSEGYQVFGDGEQLPGYASEAMIGGSAWTWNETTSDPAALQRAAQPESRLAACTYSADMFEIQMNLPASETHRIGLYCLDWDTVQRSEKIDVIKDGVVSSSVTVTDFHNGKYLVWEVSGAVTFRMSRISGLNAVLSGLFFDPAAGAQPLVQAPQISPAGGTFSGPVDLSMMSETTGAQIYYTLDGSTPGTNSTVYTGPFALSSSATVSARGFKDGMTPSSVASANFIINSSGGAGTASFIGFDNSTQGTWRGTYGSEGYVIAEDGTSLPEYANITPSGASSHIWAYGVSEAAALQMAATTNRIASCWYAGDVFEMEIKLSDGQAHEVSLYCLDWDLAGRSEGVEIFDAASGAVLDSRELAGFGNGRWVRWNVSGDVRVRVSRISGPNAVLSGMFFE